MDGYTKTSARFSPCGLYRYTLERWWAGMWEDRRYVAWICLNPSTATAEIDDPTMRRCGLFSKQWGYAGMIVTNIFAYRSTDPQKLYPGSSAFSKHWCLGKPICGPVGPENDEAILRIARGASLVIVAWGVHGALQDRGKKVIELLHGIPLHCLGVTKARHPRHPLYTASDTWPIPYKPLD
jgi:hypothetical protein